jgi:hypothetical protein
MEVWFTLLLPLITITAAGVIFFLVSHVSDYVELVIKKQTTKKGRDL